MNNFSKKVLTRRNTIHSKLFSNTNRCNVAYPKIDEKPKWNSIVNDAERVVGYPTSFLSLRWILNDEIANVATHLRRLVGTNHHLLKIVKNLLFHNEQPTWGLIVLLISKVAGLNSNYSELEWDRTADILHSQRIIAEVTEMIKTSHLFHRSIINIDVNDKNSSDLYFGNKLALLCGDYLLSTSFKELARLKNYQVQETMASVLRDLTETAFLGFRDKQNQPIPSKPVSVQKDIDIPLELGVDPLEIESILGNMKAEWTLRNVIGGGTLLGKSCQCSLILGNHESHVQELGYKFGRNLALAWQASAEKDSLQEQKFSLISAPVMFHLEFEPAFYKEIEKELSKDEIDYNLIRNAVMSGPGLERTLKVQNEYSQSALRILESFSNSDSKNALINIIKSL